MQHVVQIAFDFDDERVKKILEDSTVEKVQKDIKQAIIDQLFDKPWGNKHADLDRDPLREWAIRYIKELIAEYKDEIVKQAAKEFAASMKRSPKIREQFMKEATIASQMANIVNDPFHDIYSNGKTSTLQNRREEDE